MKSWLAGVCLLAVGCGAARPVVRPPDLSGLEAADALVLQGCYDCLLDARATYRRIGLGAGRPAVIARLFETNILIALRHKELSLDPSEPLAEARGVANELPADIEASRYLALAEGVAPEDIGTPRKMVAAFRSARERAGYVAKLDAELAWLRTATLAEPFRKYLELAADCSYPFRRRPAGTVAPPRLRQPGDAEPSLVAYRTAICQLPNQPVLYRIREAQPRFAEASVVLARIDIALAGNMGPGQAGQRLEEGRARFPASPLVNYLSGSFNQAIGDCDTALLFYEETLSIAPTHEDAQLGRTICRSYLKQTEPAIADATQMIGMRTDNVGEAYYWRAFNKHVKKEFADARVDVETAKRHGVSDQVYTLAGMIKYDMDDLEAAQVDLQTARAVPNGEDNCTAIWYLGLVQTKKQGWAVAGKNFEDAMNCYERAIAGHRRGLQTFEARTDLDATYRERKIAALKTAIVEATDQRYASAMNAANYYATASNIAAARRLVEIAAEDPKLAGPVNKLREWLKDK